MLLKGKMVFGLVLVGLLALVAGACTTADDAAADLEDKMWVLKSYGESTDQQAVLEGTRVTATFDSAQSRVEGSASCNSYFGDYEINGDKLSIPLIGNTEMYCIEPEGAMDQETQYLTILGNSQSFEIADDQLRIVAGDQLLIFNAE